MDSGDQSEAQLRQEIERLLQQIADIKQKAEDDLVKMREAMTQDKERELGALAEKHKREM